MRCVSIWLEVQFRPHYKFFRLDFSLSNYGELLFATEFVRYFAHILIAAVGAIVLNVVAATLAGYGLTWFAFPSKETFAFGTFFSYIFPPMLAVTARQRQGIEHVDDDGCDAGGLELGGSSLRASRTQHFMTRVEQLRHISQPLRTCHFPIHIRLALVDSCENNYSAGPGATRRLSQSTRGGGNTHSGLQSAKEPA